jgi:hypothetical protein
VKNNYGIPQGTTMQLSIFLKMSNGDREVVHILNFSERKIGS